MSANTRMERSNRRNYRERQDKPQWEIEKEEAERKKKDKAAKNMEFTTENFPSLGGGGVKAPVVWGGRKFSELASDWKADSDEKKAAEEKAKQGFVKKDDHLFVMPTFHPSAYYVEEDEEEESAPVVEKNQEENDDDGWVTVDHSLKREIRKARKQARFEEKMRRFDNGEEPEDEHHSEKEDDSCWQEEAAPAGKEYTV